MPKRHPIDPEVAAVFSDRLGKAMKFSNPEHWPRCQRRAKKVTQEEVGETIEVGQGLVHLWLKGERLPRGDDLARICQFLRVSADWLLGVRFDPADREHAQTTRRRVLTP